MKYTNSAVGGGPDGYDYHDDGDTMEWNDVKANNTYSTARLFRLHTHTLLNASVRVGCSSSMPMRLSDRLSIIPPSPPPLSCNVCYRSTVSIQDSGIF